MNAEQYRRALDRAEDLVELLSKPAHDWPRIEAHARALAALARAESTPTRDGAARKS